MNEIAIISGLLCGISYFIGFLIGENKK